ncbi:MULTISPECIES: hypothetical protein [Pseudescherichia]|uniref:hypothetical protein n=1 Tax=Pseudescherichia TaxID=2055880 RepID=UPI001643BF37
MLIGLGDGVDKRYGTLEMGDYRSGAACKAFGVIGPIFLPGILAAVINNGEECRSQQR